MSDITPLSLFSLSAQATNKKQPPPPQPLTKNAEKGQRHRQAGKSEEKNQGRETKRQDARKTEATEARQGERKTTEEPNHENKHKTIKLGKSGRGFKTSFYEMLYVHTPGQPGSQNHSFAFIVRNPIKSYPGSDYVLGQITFWVR